MLNALHSHIVTLHKTNGIICEGIKANVQSERIFVQLNGNKELPPIEAGDIIEHKQSNGVTEQYRVFDPCYYDTQLGKGVGIGKHYQCKVQKQSTIEQHQTKSVFNINSNQVNIASDYATINAVQNNGLDMSQVKTLIKAVRQSIGTEMSEDNIESITESLDVLEEQLARPTPKRSVVKSLLTGIKAIAGTAEFGAAVTALVQYVQTVI